MIYSQLHDHIVLHGAGNLASTYYERGQTEMAILYYKQAISCDPRFLEAYNNMVGLIFLCSIVCVTVDFFIIMDTEVSNFFVWFVL